MTMYCTLAEARATLGLDPTDAVDDAYISACIIAASARIDSYCGRVFTLTTPATPQLFAPDPTNLYEVQTDDIATTAGLIVATGVNGTYPTVIANYELSPVNGIGPNGRTGWPYTSIRAIAQWFLAPVSYQRRYTIQVTAQWGWLAVPDDVQMACRLLTREMFRAKFGDSQLAGQGIAIAPQNQQVVADLLYPYRLAEAYVGIA